MVSLLESVALIIDSSLITQAGELAENVLKIIDSQLTDAVDMSEVQVLLQSIGGKMGGMYNLKCIPFSRYLFYTSRMNFQLL